MENEDGFDFPFSIFHFPFPKIYPITNTQISNLSHHAQVERLIAGGAEFIQLREKNLSPDEFYAQAKIALEIARANGAKIIINDRADIALALQADGVHLGQDDLPPDAARKILGDAAIIGFSTHDLNQAIAAIKLPIDYLAIGPVFATRTKQNAEAVVGLDAVKIVREAIGDFPLVAVGGINLTNFQMVLDAGADTVAVIGDLVSEANKITEKMQKFISLSRQK